MQSCFHLFLLKTSLNAAICGEATVHGNNRTRNKSTGRIICEPHQSTDKVGNLTKLFHRRSRQNFARPCRRRAVFIEKKCSVLVGYKEPRRNRITTNITRSKMHCEPLCKVGDTCLCCTVCRNLCQWSVCVHGRNIDNIPPSLNHILCKYLRYQERAGNIEIKHKF